MGQLIVTPFGQTPFGQTPSTAKITQTLEEQYFTLRTRCIERWGEDFCTSVLPRNMVYAVTRRGEGYTLPWWAWMGIGYVAAKMLRL